METFDPPSPETERLADATDALLQDKKLPAHGKTPELDMAIRLKTSHQAPHLSRAVDQRTEQALLNRFAKEKAPRWNFAVLWKPILAGAAFGAILLAVTLTVIPSPEPATLAEVQDFSSLSEAEILLGQLPADAVTEDGIRVADLRQTLHDINAIEASANTTLDPEATRFPHVELRDKALTLIAMETSLVQDLPPQRISMIDLSPETDEFAGKVAGWPTTNEGVDYETHSKAVNTFLEHEATWDDYATALAQTIVQQY